MHIGCLCDGQEVKPKKQGQQEPFLGWSCVGASAQMDEAQRHSRLGHRHSSLREEMSDWPGWVQVLTSFPQVSRGQYGQ